ncbi:MAG: TrkH family potassium uptake protein [Lachnospiraceae bacterium]|nr:TrkH family potassium uptake protein [Lachnospiraceae bacterium]
MNSSMIRYILGNVIKLEGLFLLLPCVFSLIYQEKEGAIYLVLAMICVALGMLLTRKKPENTVFYLKEGCIATSLSWIVLSFFGCIPFMVTGEIPSFTDAMFETMSGFTTTGASILSDVEALSHTSLFWRSFTHWIGGMGILVFLLAVVPMGGGSNMNLMRAESPGPSVGKLVPKMRHTARILYLIYLGLTLLELILLLIARMPWFDAICIAVGTAGTGGFGVLNSSIAGYSVAVQWIVTIFMILFGINFNAYYLILFGEVKKAFRMEEVRAFLLIILAAIVVITIDIFSMCANLFDAITQSAFQVASIISSTGFATADFDQWPTLSRTILVSLMFIGACAGSTGGGMKVSRYVIQAKAIKNELHSYIHPKSIRQITMDGKDVEPGVIRSVSVYMITFFAIFVASVLLVSLDGNSEATVFTAVTATMNNIGPGLDAVGPTQNFGHFSDLSKWVFIFDMLAGRLELFPLLILFYPSIWKDMVSHRLRKSRKNKV